MSGDKKEIDEGPRIAKYARYGVKWRDDRSPDEIEETTLLPFDIAVYRVSEITGLSLHATHSLIRRLCETWDFRMFKQIGRDTHEQALSQVNFSNAAALSYLLLLPTEVDGAAQETRRKLTEQERGAVPKGRPGRPPKIPVQKIVEEMESRQKAGTLPKENWSLTSRHLAIWIWGDDKKSESIRTHRTLPGKYRLITK